MYPQQPLGELLKCEGEVEEAKEPKMTENNSETIRTAHFNGVMDDGYDVEERSKMRPVDIDADMREMERRKRVELIMNSRPFREELERIIELQLRDGNNSTGLLQQISDMVGFRYSNHIFRNSSCAIPINDIRGREVMSFSKGEKILRCKLAALFRLIDLNGWSQNIYNHLTARLNKQEEHFLVNPYGLLYSEVTASSLIKVDMQGNVIESGTTNFPVNAAGFQLFATIYAARPDLNCIIHIRTPSVLAVSSLKEGLLPLCQEAAVIGEVSQHSYIGILNESEERDKIARNLGPNNKVILLTNHGALCCGETIEETFFNAYNTHRACETQLKIIPFGKDNLTLLSDETRKSMYDAARKAPESFAFSNVPSAAVEKKCRVGSLEFEAFMRMLDNAGFRTGYVYSLPLIKAELPRSRNDVEVPPAVSSLGYLLEEEEYYKQGLWKKQFAVKGNDRIRWLNSPNVYQKVEILETGTPDPKKITKWVAETSPSHTSTSIKIENALQFVPKNTNPKEFKKLQKQIKENRRADKITSGPQSHILEEVSWEEIKKLQDANMSGTNDQVVLVGAASKGIIQREYQHSATVYKSPYAKNPFDTITDEELENYKKDVSRKQRGYSYIEEDESDALSSSLPPSSKNAALSSSLPPSSQNAAGFTSETEDNSLANEMKVIRIQTSSAPKESRAEVVLSDDLAYFGYPTDVLCTKRWEQRKFSPILRVIAIVKITRYPTECPEPSTVYIDSDESYIDLDALFNSYHQKAHQMCTLRKMFNQVLEEIGQKFENGSIFRRSLQCAMIRGFDSSEVEYTTIDEIPRVLRNLRSNSPHDFSSTGTTEDEEEASSSPGGALLSASSLSSLISCIGVEYEEQNPPQIEHYNENSELITSFIATSNDTSMDDVTVIYRSTSDLYGRNYDREKEIEIQSEDNESIDEFSVTSLSDDESDEKIHRSTYFRLSDLDYDEHKAIESFRKEATILFDVSETKFHTELPVIYEEVLNAPNEAESKEEKIHERSVKIEDICERYPIVVTNECDLNIKVDNNNSQNREVDEYCLIDTFFYFLVNNICIDPNYHFTNFESLVVRRNSFEESQMKVPVIFEHLSTLERQSCMLVNEVIANDDKCSSTLKIDGDVKNSLSFEKQSNEPIGKSSTESSIVIDTPVNKFYLDRYNLVTHPHLKVKDRVELIPSLPLDNSHLREEADESVIKNSYKYQFEYNDSSFDANEANKRNYHSSVDIDERIWTIESRHESECENVSSSSPKYFNGSNRDENSQNSSAIFGAYTERAESEIKNTSALGKYFSELSFEQVSRHSSISSRSDVSTFSGKFFWTTAINDESGRENDIGDVESDIAPLFYQPIDVFNERECDSAEQEILIADANCKLQHDECIMENHGDGSIDIVNKQLQQKVIRAAETTFVNRVKENCGNILNGENKSLGWSKVDVSRTFDENCLTGCLDESNPQDMLTLEGIGDFFSDMDNEDLYCDEFMRDGYSNERNENDSERSLKLDKKIDLCDELVVVIRKDNTFRLDMRLEDQTEERVDLESILKHINILSRFILKRVLRIMQTYHIDEAFLKKETYSTIVARHDILSNENYNLKSMNETDCGQEIDQSSTCDTIITEGHSPIRLNYSSSCCDTEGEMEQIPVEECHGSLNESKIHEKETSSSDSPNLPKTPTFIEDSAEIVTEHANTKNKSPEIFQRSDYAFQKQAPKYDFNQNEISGDTCSQDDCDPYTMETNNFTTSEAQVTDFSLKLRLHIEWNDKSIKLSHASSQSSLHEGSPESDFLEQAGREGPSKAENYFSSLFILKDFKQNYPKFIQYSDFSPKIKRSANNRRLRQCVSRTTHTCRRKSCTKSINSSSCPRNVAGQFSENSHYRRYSNVSSDWSLVKNRSLLFPNVEADSKSSLVPEPNVSTVDRYVDAVSFETSTPNKEGRENENVSTYPVLSPIMSSLEEFELLESLLEGGK